MADITASPIYLRDLHESERPRERLATLGPQALSNAELIAILLRVGVKGEGAVSVGQRLLNKIGGLSGLHRAPFEALMDQHGLGEATGSDFEIVKTYGSELRGIVNYYSMAYNIAPSFNPVKHLFIESAARTLANKHKISRSSVFAKYRRTGEQGVKALIVKVPNPKRPDNFYYAKLGDHPIRTSFATAIPDKIEKFYMNRKDHVQRLLAATCELCGSQDGIAVHHIRKLADI